MNYGIKASFPGYGITNNILTVPSGSFPDPNGIQFSSGWFVYKILYTGSATVSIASTLPSNATTTSVSIGHPLGYTPLAMIYFSPDNINWFPTNCDSEGSPTGQPFRSALVSTTSTQVNVDIVSSHLAAYTMYLRYVIFAEVGV